MAGIALRDVTKRFAGTATVQHACFTIHDDESEYT
jgi:hypothetical protein